MSNTHDSSAKHLDRMIMLIFLGFLFLLCIVPLVIVLVRGNSPAVSPERNFNIQRAQDINRLQSDIRNFYQTQGYLPSSLNQLSAQSYFYDPQTGNEYTYYTNSNTEYTICYLQTYANNSSSSIFEVILPPFHAFDNEYTSQACNDYSVVPQYPAQY